MEGVMAATDVELVRNGFSAAARGDIEPLVALFDENMQWRGIERGVLWWRHSPA